MAFLNSLSVSPARENKDSAPGWVRPLAVSFTVFAVLLFAVFLGWKRFSLFFIAAETSPERAAELGLFLGRLVLPASIAGAVIMSIAVYFAVATYFRARLIANTLVGPLAAARSKMRELYDAAPIAYAVVDTGGFLRDPNRAFLRLTAKKEAEIAGHSLCECVPDSARDECAELLAHFRSGVPVVDRELPIRHGDDVRWTLFSLFIVRQLGRGQEGIAAFVDVTDRRALENAKTEFVSLASHQLRTPLAAIQWSIDMLDDSAIGTLNEKQRRYSQKVYDTNKQMIALVDTLLNISRIESGSLVARPQPTNIPAIVEDIVADLTLQLGMKTLDVRTSLDPELALFNTDPNLMRLVLDNLISNAFKYTPDKGRVDAVVSREGRALRIMVADTGCGIPADVHDFIFSKLFRAENAQKVDPKGLGLGLYMVRSVIDLLGGSVSFVSEEGGGTTFSALVPES